MSKHTARLLALMLIVMGAGSVHAFKFTPIESVFSVSGRGTSQTFQVENPGAAPIAVELSMFHRAIDVQGEDQLEPADGDFTIYPSQLVLQPGGRQSVRVQWQGKSMPTQEIAYRLMAEQLPLDLQDAQTEGAALKLLVKYMAAIYVRPAGTEARLSVKADSTAADLMLLTFRNDGSEHVLLRDDMLRFRALGKDIVLDDAQRKAIKGKNVLAGATRTVQIPWHAPAGAESLDVELVAPEPD